MGRYYSGDIEGKFWFAVQSSNAADRFGVVGERPSELHYYFSTEDLPAINAEIEKIERELGDKLTLIGNFFRSNMGYNDDMLAKANITSKEVSEYADLQLGCKIRDYVELEGDCNFDAEC